MNCEAALRLNLFLLAGAEGELADAWRRSCFVCVEQINLSVVRARVVGMACTLEFITGERKGDVSFLCCNFWAANVDRFCIGTTIALGSSFWKISVRRGT